MLKTTLLKAIKEAGALVKEGFYGTFKVDFKGQINNLVTEVDQASERLISSIIKAQFPDHGLVGEEYGIVDQDATYKWIIDPIDGTVNFAHKIPICCVSIGIMHHDEMIMGAVYNPMMNELFFAEKGKGAFLNDQPIQVSQNDNIDKAFLVTGFPYSMDELEGKPLAVFNKLVGEGLPVRRLGSAALDLCWVACGRFDAFWEYKLQPWDIAAGYLILSEAGGKITDFENHSYTIWDKQTLATNGLLHDAMLNKIKL